MRYTVYISKQADQDLRSIYEYIAFSLSSPESALSQLNRLEEKIIGLNEFPFRFPVYKNDIRYVPIDNYLVFYTVDETKQTAFIVRVMYGKRDVENII